MIPNFDSCATVPVLSPTGLELLNSGYPFWVVGSMFLGTDNENSDIDFVTFASDDIQSFLVGLGFKDKKLVYLHQGDVAVYEKCDTDDGNPAQIQVVLTERPSRKVHVMNTLRDYRVLQKFDYGLRNLCSFMERHQLWDALYQLTTFGEK